MYVLLDDRGKQHKVEKGDIIEIDKIDKPNGETIEFDKVLLFIDGDNVQLGQPYVKGCRVMAKVLEKTKGQKVTIFKKKRRKDYKKKQGHRHKYTKIMIEDISFAEAAKTASN